GARVLSRIEIGVVKLQAMLDVVVIVESAVHVEMRALVHEDSGPRVDLFRRPEEIRIAVRIGVVGVRATDAQQGAAVLERTAKAAGIVLDDVEAVFDPRATDLLDAVVAKAIHAGSGKRMARIRHHEPVERLGPGVAQRRIRRAADDVADAAELAKLVDFADKS